MKIAIASNGEDETSEVSEVTGRAHFFLLFEDNKLVKTIKNPFRMGGGGAGFSVAEMLSEEKVQIIVSGKIGPNVKSVLDSKGMKHIELHGVSVKDALEKAK